MMQFRDMIYEMMLQEGTLRVLSGYLIHDIIVRGQDV